MKYAVIKYLNPAMDVCAHHPSQIATMFDGGDPWPVTSVCVSRLYDTREEAWENCKKRYRKLESVLRRKVRKPWYIVDGFMDTLFVGKDDQEGFPEMGSSEWIYKMEVIAIPETDKEVKLYSRGKISV